MFNGGHPAVVAAADKNVGEGGGEGVTARRYLNTETSPAEPAADSSVL